MTGVETACHVGPDNGERIPADHSRAHYRDRCGVCFPDGEIPQAVAEVVTGHNYTAIHLPAEYEHLLDPSVTNGYQESGFSGLASTLKSDDFGPEDLDALGDGGGA